MLKRLLMIFLCICLLPVFAAAEELPADVAAPMETPLPEDIEVEGFADPEADTAAEETAEDPEDTPDIDGLPADVLDKLPQDDVAEEV